MAWLNGLVNKITEIFFMSTTVISHVFKDECGFIPHETKRRPQVVSIWDFNFKVNEKHKIIKK